MHVQVEREQVGECGFVHMNETITSLTDTPTVLGVALNEDTQLDNMPLSPSHAATIPRWCALVCFSVAVFADGVFVCVWVYVLCVKCVVDSREGVFQIINLSRSGGLSTTTISCTRTHITRRRVCIRARVCLQSLVAMQSLYSARSHLVCMTMCPC